MSLSGRRVSRSQPGLAEALFDADVGLTSVTSLWPGRDGAVDLELDQVNAENSTTHLPY